MRVYGNSVRIINDDIVAAFRPDQIESAMQRAKELESSVLDHGKGSVRMSGRSNQKPARAASTSGLRSVAPTTPTGVLDLKILG